ncbi:MAG: 50S ribosomal protein L9 [Lentisphaeria bacterium]
MATELILLQNIDKLGKVGDTVRVSDGYARNYLLPRGYGQPVTKSALRKAEAIKVAQDKAYAEAVEAAKASAAKVEGTVVTVAMEANEEGKLFGSVTSRVIAEKLSEQTGIEIKAANVLVDEAFRATGEYTVEVAIMAEVSANVKVVITAA